MIEKGAKIMHSMWQLPIYVAGPNYMAIFGSVSGCFIRKCGAPGGIRTPDQLVRSQIPCGLIPFIYQYLSEAKCHIDKISQWLETRIETRA